jgi:hypothetical protein
VRHPKCPDWGTGQVLGEDGDIVSVVFQEEGVKRLSTRFVNLELVEAPAGSGAEWPSIRPQTGVDLDRLEAVCLLFHEEMKDNRKTTDDGRVALKVLQDIKERGDLLRSTRRQLFSWLYTAGNPYQRGVDIARQICKELYGRVPTREEVESENG